MATAKRKGPSPTRKRRTTGTPSRRPSTRAAGQGGLAALAIALLLGALGLMRSGLGNTGSGADDGGPNGPSEADVRSGVTATARATGDGTGPSSAAEEALFGAINRARADHRLAALADSAPLGRAARAHSNDLRATSRCSHDGSDGSSLEDRLAAVDANLQRYGEVVACGSASAAAAVEQWLASSAHRDILLGRGFRTVGVGVALGANAADGRWTAVLGTP